MDDLSFLASGGDATATLVVLLPDASITHIAGVSPLRILDKCPLLYHALEFGEHATRQANIEAPSRYAIISLLRYIYTGEYFPDYEFTFLLNHVETFSIADSYDMPDLQLKAYVNLSRQTEFSCSLKEAPVTLCETIRFIYTHSASFRSSRGQSLLDTLLNYCLAIFTYQGLGERSDFQQLVFDLPDFHQDLCRTSMQRDFQDEGAMDIMRMPVSKPTPHSREMLDARALGDFQYELWKDYEDPSAAVGCPSNKGSPQAYEAPGNGEYMLVHRPKNPMASPTLGQNGSDAENQVEDCMFTLVHRPKMFIDTSSSPGLSPSNQYSPEWVPVSPNGVKAESPADNVDRNGGTPADGSEDEWSLL